MKNIYITLAVLFLAVSSIFSQDSIYVYKNGIVESKYAVSSIDSLSFSNTLDSLILRNNGTELTKFPISNIDSISFMPFLPTGTFIDIDGNRYTTVKIGTQTWMVENLKTTRYRNGDTIPEVQGNTAWINQTTGAYSNYANDPNNGNTFGRLYNWYAVNDSRNLAPAGWHIPSVQEWAILENFLIGNGYNYDGTISSNKIAKALAAKTGWKESSEIGSPGKYMTLNNSSGFNGLSGGMRYGNNGVFSNMTDGAYWWTRNSNTNVEAHYRAMFYRYSFFMNYTTLQSYGYAIRCIKSDLPTVTTNTVNSITINTATSGGNVSFDGQDPILYRGVCWNTSLNPTVNDYITINGNGLGVFNSTLSNLKPGTTYYVRAYATNTVGTSYGEEFSFKTLATTPTVLTAQVTAVTSNSASASGVIITDGGATITEKGFCWSTNENPTTTDNITTAIGDSMMTGNLTGLNAGTLYYVRAYATNEIGTTYGQQLSFTTLDIPAITTVEISALTDSSAISGGNLISDGGDVITAKGVCWSTNENPTITDSISINGAGTDAFISNITGLSPATTYYVRAYATNSVGTAYGNTISFTTPATIPTVSTTQITAITSVTATGGGEIIKDGGSGITAKGVCWSTSENPTIADSTTVDGIGNEAFISNLTNLTGGTIYYVRAYATNSVGTSYGNEVSFTTLPVEEEDKLTGIQIIPNWIDGGIPAVEVGYINSKTAPIAKVMFNEQDMVYRFNPTTADLSKMTWAFIHNSTRITAPGQGAPAYQTTLFDTPFFTNNNDGTGTFNLKVKNWIDPAVGETHLFALQAYDQDDSSGNPAVVSDNAKVVTVQYNAFISDAKKSSAIVNTYVHYRTEIPFNSAVNDFNLNITTPVNLNELVWATANKGGAAERRFETYGFNDYKYEFSLPTYLGDDGVTNQNSFVTLNAENVLSANGGSSAIDRTPLILVKLLTNDGRLVAQSYIKFKIVAN